MRRLLLRLYPPAWRRRYGDELDQLVEDIGLSPSVVLDVARNALGERVGELERAFTRGDGMKIGPAWRHPTALALVGLAVLAPVLVFVVGSLLAYQLGVAALANPMESVNAWLAQRRVFDLFIVLSPAVALLIATVPLVRLDLTTGDGGREATVGIRFRAANAIVGLMALGVAGVLVWHIVFESVMELGA